MTCLKGLGGWIKRPSQPQLWSCGPSCEAGRSSSSQWRHVIRVSGAVRYQHGKGKFHPLLESGKPGFAQRGKAVATRLALNYQGSHFGLGVLVSSALVSAQSSVLNIHHRVGSWRLRTDRARWHLLQVVSSPRSASWGNRGCMGVEKVMP